MRTIAEYLEENALRAPSRAALVAPARAPLSHAALFEQVLQTARALNAMGVGRGDRVAMALPGGPEAALAFLAVASCATAAPLNPGYREAELDVLLSELNPRALLVCAGMDAPARNLARVRGLSVLELEPREGDGAGAFALSGDPAATGRPGFAAVEDTALALPTSGTTARPKLVPLTHRNLSANAENIGKAFGLGEHDRCLNIMPLFHAHALVIGLLSSLVAGGSVVCPAAFDPAAFLEWLAELGPT